MSSLHVIRLAFVLSCLIPCAVRAQVPADLQKAMQARDEAIARADTATWDRFTSPDFTDVRTDGTLMTRAERRTLLKTQSPTTPAPRDQVQIRHYRDAYVRRSRTADAWVLDIWVKDAAGWRVVAAQLTTAKK